MLYDSIVHYYSGYKHWLFTSNPTYPYFPCYCPVAHVWFTEKIPFRDLEGGMIAGASAGLGAVFIFSLLVY